MQLGCRLPAALILLFLCNTLAAAQTLDRPAAFGSLREGITVRVRSAEGRFEGYLAAPRLDTLGLLGNDGSLSLFPYAGIDSLWVRGKPHYGYGALIGAIVAFLPIGIACAQELDECGLIPFGIILPAVGAYVGVLIGAHIPSWRLHFPVYAKSESRSW